MARIPQPFWTFWDERVLPFVIILRLLKNEFRFLGVTNGSRYSLDDSNKMCWKQ
jgi:hypothetical protein